MQEFTVQLFDNGSAQISGTGANLELRFGYSKNAHIYSVKFIRSKEWEDLYIRVHFHPEADIYDVDPVLAQNNIVNIPAMVTSMPGKGKLTIEGTDGYKTITSADIPYRVSENSGIDSETDPEPGESSFQQFVDAVKEDAKSAEQAAKDAESALAETKEAASLALSDIETARTNAIFDIEKIESEVKGEIQEDVDSAKSSAEAASKSAEEAKSAADSAKKSLSDLETAKESALSDISKEKDTSVSAVGSAKESALTELSKNASSAIQNVKTAETNAIDAVKAEGSSQKTALSNASNAALTSIDSAKQGAVKAVEDKASEESSAIDEKAAQVIQSVQNAGDAEISAIGQATTSGIEQITQSAGQHLTRIDSAADDAVQDIMDVKEDSLDEFEAVNAHPPIQNPKTGKWQVYSAETASYVDTKYDWEGGYYSPSVDSEGNLTWQASKEGMDDIPSSNIRGPQGLGVPTPTTNDYGKTPTVNAAGTGYELTGPYAPLSAAITETAKGNSVSITDSVEWPLLGLKVYGKSTQDGTPSPESPVPIVSAGDGGNVEVLVTGKNLLDISKMPQQSTNGITFSLENGGIKVSGTGTDNTDSPIFAFRLPVGTYISNMNKTRFPWLDSVGYVVERGDSGRIYLNGSSVFKVLDGDVGKYFYFRVKVGVQVNEIIYPQIEVGSTSTPYEPYQSQSLTATTPNGLPGIPVDSGGNYTDASGQQWVCDEVDFARGMYVQRLLSVVGRSVTGFTDDFGRKQVQITLEHQGKNTKGLSNHFVYQDVQSPGYFSVDRVSPLLYARFELDTSLEQINQVLQDSTFIYELANPIETPLSDEELAAYRALHTYDGTTVVTPDDALAEVEVDYIVKPKAYIEKKLTAIETRLNAFEISEALEGE